MTGVWHLLIMKEVEDKDRKTKYRLELKGQDVLEGERNLFRPGTWVTMAAPVFRKTGLW